MTGGEEHLEDAIDERIHFITRIIDRGLWRISSPVLTSLILSGSLPVVLVISYFIINWSSINWLFILTYSLTGAWVSIAPFLIWRYDREAFPHLVSSVQPLFQDKSRLRNIAKKYDKFFVKGSRFMIPVWILIISAVFVVSRPALIKYGMAGPYNSLLWANLLYAIYIGILVGQGFMGVLTTILAQREISKMDIEIDPRHPDSFGGLKAIGSFSNFTAMLFASGSLTVPMLIQFGRDSQMKEIIYSTIIIYSIAIALLFIYPTLRVKIAAERHREQKLSHLQSRYNKIEEELAKNVSESSANQTVEELNLQLELQRIDRKYDKFSTVSLYPINIRIVAQIVLSVGAPIFLTVIENILVDMI